MGWRAANRSDLGWIEVLLFAHIEGSMFLIGNLRDHGFGSDHPHGLTLWVRETRDGVFAITNTGSVMMMAPGCGNAEWQDAGQLLGPREVTAVIGRCAALLRPMGCKTIRASWIGMNQVLCSIRRNSRWKSALMRTSFPSRMRRAR